MDDSDNDGFELWVVAADTGNDPNAIPDISLVVDYAEVPADHFVFASTYMLEIPRQPVRHIHMPDARGEAELWNAALNHIYTQSGGDPFDVAILFPNFALSRFSIDSLRSHMRTLDVVMGEPDVANSLDGKSYAIREAPDFGDPFIPAVVVAGEQGFLFDSRYRDGISSWFEFCIRARAIGRSVLVAPEPFNPSREA